MFGSLRSIPYLRSYAEAFTRFNNTKPIRGRTPEVRPLGNRRYTHLQINTDGNGDVLCILYQTPVVTFRSNNTVVISPRGWTTHFTCAFISNILPGINGRHQRGKMVLDIHGDEYVVERDAEIVLERVDNKWQVKGAEGAKTFVINKAKANNVRGKYKQFLKFYDGFIKLNTQDIEDADPDEPFTAQRITTVSMQLLRDMLGTKQGEISQPTWNNGVMQFTKQPLTMLDATKWGKLHGKPTWYTPDSENGKQIRAEWDEQREYLLGLMRSDDTSDHMTAAAIVFCLGAHLGGLNAHREQKMESVTLAATKAKGLALENLYWLHAEEVLEYVQLPVGRVPTTDYGRWLFEEVRKEMTDLVSGRG